MEENFSLVVSCAIESVFLGTDYTWVSNGSEIESKLISIIVSYQLIEYFTHSIDSLWLQNHVCWGVLFGEMITTKDSYRGGDEDFTVCRLCGPHGINHTNHIDINCEVWVLLT